MVAVVFAPTLTSSRMYFCPLLHSTRKPIKKKHPTMPIYIYETIPQKKGQKPRRFEVRQSMLDKPLRKDPETGLPVRRVITGGRGYFGPKRGGSSSPKNCSKPSCSGCTSCTCG